MKRVWIYWINLLEQVWCGEFSSNHLCIFEVQSLQGLCYISKYHLCKDCAEFSFLSSSLGVWKACLKTCQMVWSYFYIFFYSDYHTAVAHRELKYEYFDSTESPPHTHTQIMDSGSHRLGSPPYVKHTPKLAQAV